jgi:hypothetical protein
VHFHSTTIVINLGILQANFGKIDWNVGHPYNLALQGLLYIKGFLFQIQNNGYKNPQIAMFSTILIIV